LKQLGNLLLPEFRLPGSTVAGRLTAGNIEQFHVGLLTCLSPFGRCLLAGNDC
jgi:hypothetical protein